MIRRVPAKHLCDLTATPLAAMIEGYFVRLLEGPGAARRLLQAELA